MKPYSQDLRKRVLAQAKAGKQTQAAIAQQFAVSLSTVEKWLRRRRETGKSTPRAQRHGPQRKLQNAGALIRAEIKRQPDLTLAELCERIAQATGIVANPSMMCRELQHLRLPRKKKSLHDSERDTLRVQRLRRQFKKRIREDWSSWLHHLKFIDESGVHLGLTRFFGRAAPGQRVTDATPGDSGPHYALLAALGLQGVQAPWLLQGAMDGDAFEVYTAQVLVPSLQPGDIVLIDNLSFHKAEHIRQLIESAGARLEFLPPYSPDLNPIELCWSKIKTALRTAKARTFEALVAALDAAFATVSTQDITAWFAHCGYVQP